MKNKNTYNRPFVIVLVKIYGKVNDEDLKLRSNNNRCLFAIYKCINSILKNIARYSTIAFWAKQSRAAIRSFVFGEGGREALMRETKTYDLVSGESAVVQFNYSNGLLETVEVDCRGGA